MEELLNSMKVIFKNAAKEEDSNKFLHFDSKYSYPTKTANWFVPQEAYPKDNDPYNPPGGHYFLSTYNRLGTQDVAPWESTTQSMLRQACDKVPDLSVYKPMVDFTTKELLQENDEDYKGLGSEELEYITTYTYDYRHPFPYARRYSMEPEVKTPHFGIKKTSMNSHTDQIDTKYLDDDLYVSKCISSKLIHQ